MSTALSSVVALEAPVKPFLKWAGGKTKLLPDILARFPARFGSYYEPFLGGGAVFFATRPQRAFLSDLNDELIATYRAVRDDVSGVMRALDRHVATEEHFYRVRALPAPSHDGVARAARTIYLNRTCFNGLYRVNRRGEFNVPFGRYENPTICNEDGLMRASQALASAEIEHGSVFDMARRAKRGDLVYFDPPYDPVSATASFTSYAREGFGKPEQEQLAGLFTELDRRGVHVILSNSDTPFMRKLYQGFRIDTVFCRRAINARADRRGAVTEILVSNT